ncbi:MAG: hypothetical protein MHM6MM_006933, partial [Cercozoa sp. M6MM]
QDKVYGFVPFCRDEWQREDTRKLRFWDTGSWRRHLGDSLAYHISALFVVDLELFRRRRVGDRLRETYARLSQDANSLSNLDQDLPNFLQTEVPIFSLPQEWLWCDTWCNSDKLRLAKSIDLCNNPLSQEDKLSMARRVISEWDALDLQAAAAVSAGSTGSIGDRENSEYLLEAAGDVVHTDL